MVFFRTQSGAGHDQKVKIRRSVTVRLGEQADDSPGQISHDVSHPRHHWRRLGGMVRFSEALFRLSELHAPLFCHWSVLFSFLSIPTTSGTLLRFTEMWNSHRMTYGNIPHMETNYNSLHMDQSTNQCCKLFIKPYCVYFVQIKCLFLNVVLVTCWITIT